MAHLEELLSRLQELGGSDLHLRPGSPPRVRVAGQLHATDAAPLSASAVESVALAALGPERAAELEHLGEVEAGLSVAGVGRFRVSVHRQRGSLAMTVRLVPRGMPEIAELGLPPQVERFADEERGLVLVTGTSGSGKTTTLAALLDRINRRRSCHILTIEDPIEVLHADQAAMVTQREVGADTRSYAEALRRALRQDADVIFVGEIADEDTASAALLAAEVGHLVFSTMRIVGAVDTVGRFIDLFPPQQQAQARQTLAAVLRGVLSQRLLERADGKGRVAVCEVLAPTAKVLDCILDPARQADMERLLAEGQYHGMQTFDQALTTLALEGLVSARSALAASSKPEDLRIALEQGGLAADL